MDDNNQTKVANYYKPKNKKERDARRRVWDRYNAMKDDDLRKEAEADWEMADKMFRQWMPEREYGDWRSNIVLPDGFAAVQAHMQETINRRSRPILEVSNGSDMAREAFVNAILKFSMDKTGFDYQIFLAKQAAAIRGTSFVMEYYRVDKRDVQDPVGINDDGTIKYQKKEIVDFDDTITEHRENEYIFTDPSATSQNNMRDMVEREVMDWGDFKLVYGKRSDFMNVELVPKAGKVSENASFFKKAHDMTDDDVEILHYYNRNTDSYDVLANNVLIRMSPLPFKHKELPLSVFTHYTVPGQLWGMGIPKVIFTLTEERRSIRNLSLDRQHMQVDKMFLVNDLIDLDEEDTKARPGGFISVATNGMRLSEAIQPLEYGDIPSSYYQAENILLEDIRRAHGISDQMQANGSGGTATEAAMLQQSAQARINMVNTLAEMDTIVRVGRLKWSNIQFFYPAPKIETIVEDDEEQEKKVYKTIKVQGQEFSITKDPGTGEVALKTNPIDGASGFKLDKTHARYMEGDFDVIVDGEGQTQISKPLRQSKITEMFNMIALNPQLTAAIDPTKSVKRYLTINDENPTDWMRDSGLSTADWKRLAAHENMVMAAGQVLSPTEGATTDHTEEHINFTNTALYESLPDATKAIFMEHIMGEHEKNPLTGSAADAFSGAGTATPAAGAGITGAVPQGGTVTESAPADVQASSMGGADRGDTRRDQLG